MISNATNASYEEIISEQENGHKASATIKYTANPSDGDTITINGTVFTYRDSPSVTNDVQTGGDATISLTNLLTEALDTTANYTQTGISLFIEYKTIGTVGNNFTLACNFVTVPAGLTGGSNTPDADWVKEAGTTVSYVPKEIVVDTTTTSTTLVSKYTTLIQGDDVKLTDASNVITDGSLGAVTSTGSDAFYGNIGTKITLNSTNLIAIRNADAATWANSSSYGNIAITSGNIYWEYVSNNSANQMVGISTDNTHQTYYFATVASGYGWNKGDHKKYNNNVGIGYGNAWVNGDIIGVRYCYETGELEFYINGTSQGIAYTLTTNTTVYPATDLFSANTVSEMIVSASKLHYLPSGCVPYSTLLYSADISALSLATTPTKAFFRDDITTSICVEANAGRVINLPHTPVNIDATSTATSLVSTTPLATGEEVIIDDITGVIGTVTGTGPYTADITSYSLTKKPFKAMKRGSEVLTKVSSTLSQFVGTSGKTGLLATGDSVRLDGTDVVSTSVVESGTASPYTYTIDFATQASAPTTCEIMSRDTVMTKKSEVFDGTKFNVTYNDENKQGRAMNRKIEVQNVGTTVNPPLQTTLYKK